MAGAPNNLKAHRISNQDFQDLLDEAWASVATDWETQFVTDIKNRFAKYGDDLFLSTSQLEHLRRIARNDPHDL